MRLHAQPAVVAVHFAAARTRWDPEFPTPGHFAHSAAPHPHRASLDEARARVGRKKLIGKKAYRNAGIVGIVGMWRLKLEVLPGTLDQAWFSGIPTCRMVIMSSTGNGFHNSIETQ